MTTLVTFDLPTKLNEALKRLEERKDEALAGIFYDEPYVGAWIGELKSSWDAVTTKLKISQKLQIIRADSEREVLEQAAFLSREYGGGELLQIKWGNQYYR